MMRKSPFLVGAAVLFWGWQSGLLIIGAIMAVVLEGSRLVKARWEISDEDLRRIWTFCGVLFLAVGVFVFANNGGPAELAGIVQNVNYFNQHNGGLASAQTAASLLRWLPMIFFLFVAAQVFGGRDRIPLTTISFILRWRRRRAAAAGHPLPPDWMIDTTGPFFALCLFAASIHSLDENPFFYWGLCLLLGWGLGTQRPRRFKLAVWGGTLVLALASGYAGQRGIVYLDQRLQTINANWLLYFFHRPRGFDPSSLKTSLGEIGRLKTSGQIVIRVEPRTGEAPTYLREASYRRFHYNAWGAASKNDYESLRATTNNSWMLLPEKTNLYDLAITSYLYDRSRVTGNPLGLLPLPSGTARLDNLNAYLLQKYNSGSVMAEGPGLLMFDALYGPGPTIDSPPESSNDLYVAPNEWKVFDDIIITNHWDGKSDREQLGLVFAYFQNFTYSTWQARPAITNANESPVEYFLRHSHTGHCEYFATATVLLLRRLGIPARYAVGYVVHEAAGKGYVIRERDTHAWCLAWDADKQQWEDFDTTPASWIEREKAGTSSSQLLADAWSWFMLQISKLRWGQSHLRQYLIATLLPFLGYLFYRIFFQRRRRRKGAKANDEFIVRPGLDSEFYLIEKKLIARGIERAPNEPLSHWLRRALADPALADLHQSLRRLLHLHYRYRFDPRSLNPDERGDLKREAGTCLDRLSS
jgi:transglutaminase-like putative cysteine protease